jgi:hypothetical protein
VVCGWGAGLSGGADRRVLIPNSDLVSFLPLVTIKHVQVALSLSRSLALSLSRSLSRSLSLSRMSLKSMCRSRSLARSSVLRARA